MEAGQAEAGRQEPGPDAPHFPGAPEAGTVPRAPICPAARTQGCRGGLRNRPGSLGASDTSEADRGLSAGRLSGLRGAEEKAEKLGEWGVMIKKIRIKKKDFWDVYPYQIFGLLVVIAERCLPIQGEVSRNQDSRVASDQQHQTDDEVHAPVRTKDNWAGFIASPPHMNLAMHRNCQWCH